MSKTVKLDNKVYHLLDEIRGKRDTFSEVVARLLCLKSGLELTLGAYHQAAQDVNTVDHGRQ